MGWDYGIFLWVFNFISHAFTAPTRKISSWTLKEKLSHLCINPYVIYFFLSRRSLEITTWVKNRNHTSCIFLWISSFSTRNFRNDESSQNSKNLIGNCTGQLQPGGPGTLYYKNDIIPSCKSMRNWGHPCILVCNLYSGFEDDIKFILTSSFIL